MFSLLSLLLLLPPLALAAPQQRNVDPIHIPLVRRSISPEQRMAKLPHIMDAIRFKYGYKTKNQKRSTTTAAITDEGNDSSYSAAVSIGTPAQPFNLILDTGKPPFGSSDLWVATDQCNSCSGVPLFTPATSSSYKNSTNSVQITYGSGNVAGVSSQDAVSFSGFTMSQTLLSVTDTSSNLLNDKLSGIMGLGFDTLSSLQTTPFWQTLMNQNKLTSPVFSFYLARLVNQAQVDEAPGGTFTLGGTNSSLFSGNIEFINMPSGTTPSFWLQQVKTVTVQGKSFTISSSEGLAAIDTGTTLIGAPSDITKQIYSAIPGSAALTGDNQGMYAYPCSTTVSFSISFGGTKWPISDADFNLGSVGQRGGVELCAGGIFDIGNTAGGSGPGVPAWIVGDTFLKNVYTVFRGSPPAVGFAQLASGLSGDTSSGTNPISITGGGIPIPSGLPFGSNGALPRTILSTSLTLVMALSSAFLMFIAV